MALLAPSLTDFPSGNAGKEIVVALSKLKDALEVCIPDSDEISPLDDVYAVLGEAEESANRSSDKLQAGQMNANEDVEKVPNLKVYVLSTTLRDHLNTTVKLRYQTSGELGVATSAALLLRIEP